MNILAIESASTVCGVALFLNSQLIELDEIEQPRIHGKKLPVIIYDILNNHTINVDQLDGISISSGPGSYTGLRIGMSIAKGLASTSNIPIIPVPTLLAMNVCIQQNGIYWVILHSHKKHVYAQRYNSGIPDSSISFEDYQPEKHVPTFGYNLQNICNDYKSIPPSAESVGELALQYFEKWKKTNLNKLSPNYITNYNLKNVKIA